MMVLGRYLIAGHLDPWRNRTIPETNMEAHTVEGHMCKTLVIRGALLHFRVNLGECSFWNSSCLIDAQWTCNAWYTSPMLYLLLVQMGPKERWGTL